MSKCCDAAERLRKVEELLTAYFERGDERDRELDFLRDVERA